MIQKKYRGGPPVRSTLGVGLWMVCALSFWAWTGARAEANPAPRHEIVATVGMVADVVRNIAGNRANVVNLVGEGVDPHLYTPTRRDVVLLRGADIIFYNGLFLEGRMGDVLRRMERRGTPVVAVAEALMEAGDYPLLKEEDGLDPHLWMDVGAWKRVARIIGERLAEFDPPHADAYAANKERYVEELSELNEYVRGIVATIPEERRVLVTAHDAFGYFGRAHGIEVRGIQGMSTDSEAGVRDIENLIRFIAERNIPAVFIETSVSDRNVRALVEGARARGHLLRIGGELFSDAMGPPGTYEGTYIGMIDHNATTLVRALGGEAPERGMRGALDRR